MTPHRRWKQSDITDLRRRLGQGEMLPAVAEALHRAADDVERMAQRLRLPSTRG